MYITPKTYPLKAGKGDDWRLPVPVTYSDGETPFDFTGWEAHAQVRTKSSGTLIANFDSYDGTIEFDEGTMYLIRDKDNTDIEANEYVWDCRFLNPQGIRAKDIEESRFLIYDGPTE